MRLLGLDVRALPTAAVAGAENARHRWSTRRGLLLTVRDERGHVGQGEASPLPGYSPESFGTARRVLKMWCESAPPRLDLAAPVEAVRAMVARIDAGVPSARFAVETALLDLAGQRLGMPLWRLLRGIDSSEPEPVPLAGLVTSSDPREAASQAHAALGRGIRTLKIKVGRAGRIDDELAVLAAVRAEVGHAVALRLDANGTLPSVGIESTLDRLATVDPVLIEEPVALGALGEISSSPIPIAVDETLQHPDGWSWVELLAARGVLAAVVLKPMALGGALACLEWARRAQHFGVGAYVTHLFDGPVARAAAAHLALALPGGAQSGGTLACGLDRHAALAVWPPSSAPILQSATIVPDPAPGLGHVLVSEPEDSP